MKVTNLIINNFMSVATATLNLADKGLVSIEGVNRDGAGADSNGAGKSTIINAIMWCLYGEAGKNIKADSVINKKVKKDCYVQLTLEESGRSYRISRYRKHKVHKNSVVVEVQDSKGWNEVTRAGATAVQTQINEILGQDYLTFQASCFAQQDEALDIPAMTDTKLKELLERVLPVENLEELHAKATKSVADQNKLVKTLTDQMDRNTWKLEDVKRRGQEVQKLFKGYDASIVEKNAKVDELIAGKERAITTAKVKLTDLISLQEKIKGLQDEITNIGETSIVSEVFHTREIEILQEKMAQPVVDCPTCGKAVDGFEEILAGYDADIARHQEKLIEAQKHNEAVKHKKHEKSELARVMIELQEKANGHLEAERTIDRLRGEIRLLQGQYALAGDNPHKSTRDALATEFRAATALRDKLNEEYVTESAKLELLEAVQFTYSPKGVRYHMLETVAPKLTESTNNYLKVLTDGAITAVWSTVVQVGKDYKEKFKIDTAMDGEETEYGALSGGEKRKVRLACFFALQDLIASKATKNINIWCGDEIDHALDAAGIERLMVILDAKTKTKSTILVISHNEMREWIPNVAVVTRKDKVSTISGYLNEQC